MALHQVIEFSIQPEKPALCPIVNLGPDPHDQTPTTPPPSPESDNLNGVPGIRKNNDGNPDNDPPTPNPTPLPPNDDKLGQCHNSGDPEPDTPSPMPLPAPESPVPDGTNETPDGEEPKPRPPSPAWPDSDKLHLFIETGKLGQQEPEPEPEPESERPSPYPNIPNGVICLCKQVPDPSPEPEPQPNPSPVSDHGSPVAPWSPLGDGRLSQQDTEPESIPEPYCLYGLRLTNTGELVHQVPDLEPEP